MKIEPEGVRLLIRPDPVAEKTSGGIYRPDSAREQEQNATTIGTVVLLGPAVMLELDGEPLEIGHRVAFARYGGYPIRDEEADIDYRVLNDEDVIARIT